MSNQVRTSAHVLLRQLGVLSLAAFLLFSASFSAAGTPDKELSESVRSQNRSAIESIRTISCQYVAKDITPQGRIESTIDYRRSLDAVRLRRRLVYPDGTVSITEGLLKKGRWQEFTNQTRPGAKPYVTGGIRPKQQLPEVWSEALFLFHNPADKNWLPFDEMLAKPHEVHSAKWITESGRRLAYIDWAQQGTRRELWFDPAANYLVCKGLYYKKGDPEQLHAKAEVTSFKEAAPGIYFPERIEFRIYTDGRTAEEPSVRTFSNIRINQPLSANAFDFRFPAGIRIGDIIANKVYEADKEGNLKEKGDGWRIAPQGNSPNSDQESSYSRATLVEPESPTRWILLAAFLCLCIGGVMWLRRRRQT